MNDEVDVSRRRFLQRSGLAAGAAAGSPLLARDARADEHADGRFSSAVETTLRINGKTYRESLEPRVSLLDLLRERLALTGTKKGCNEGACGACTVLLDGERINACMTLAVSCEGRELTTVEGLAGEDGALHAVQQAFVDQDALQCGYCTPGQVVSAVACIREGHAGSPEEIAEWMSGNLCRCAAYPQIVAAVQQAAARTTEGEG